MDKRIHSVVKLLEYSYHRQLIPREIANAVNLSESRLRHLFKAETGLTFAQYLKSLRLRKAKELSEDSFLTSRQIMIKVGLNDESHFTRDFKKTFGLTPRQHRLRWESIDPIRRDVDQ